MQWVKGRDESRGVNAGDDVAGVVKAVGAEVFEYQPGDRVAALHRMGEDHGTYAEFTVVPANTTFMLPPNIAFEAGAGLPLSFMTASLDLYQHLMLPLPPAPDKKDMAVLIYGGSSAVGAYALQLAKLSKVGPIITVARSGIDFVKSLNAATHIVDYRQRNVEVDILTGLRGKKLALALDSISGHGSYEYISRVLQKSNGGGHIDMVDPPEDAAWVFPDGVKVTRTFASSAYAVGHRYITEEQAAADGEFSYMFSHYLSRMLAEGKFWPHLVEVLPGGLDGIIGGVKALHEGRISARKLIVRFVDCSMGQMCRFAENYRIVNIPTHQ
jgi:NADPH2:quinone reductase